MTFNPGTVVEISTDPHYTFAGVRNSGLTDESLLLAAGRQAVVIFGPDEDDDYDLRISVDGRFHWVTTAASCLTVVVDRDDA